MWQNIEEITENLSKLAVESDENKRLLLATETKTLINALHQAMREEIARVHIEMHGGDHGLSIVEKEAMTAMPERPKYDFDKIDRYLTHPNTVVTGDVLHFLMGIGYFNAKDSE